MLRIISLLLVWIQFVKNIQSQCDEEMEYCDDMATNEPPTQPPFTVA